VAVRRAVAACQASRPPPTAPAGLTQSVRNPSTHPPSAQPRTLYARLRRLLRMRHKFLRRPRRGEHPAACARQQPVRQTATQRTRHARSVVKWRLDSDSSCFRSDSGSPSGNASDPNSRLYVNTLPFSCTRVLARRAQKR
jgi:hypothetical protein